MNARLESRYGLKEWLTKSNKNSTNNYTNLAVEIKIDSVRLVSSGAYFLMAAFEKETIAKKVILITD
ncbi:hypothetical protein AMJ83_09245 [candidate division WOR_3 bacterium SM23_42]|uniref:Uncharacterized protein n=1 Tax=candidate division WOR_3 bacterium SM23_42 TaxID=1703779 RepID=A0A0S8FQA2_UNCW3|nr:MAG: hypothetical protein AMJ83_09245 [candidate division WOR_3 bacterium SM23_42]